MPRDLTAPPDRFSHLRARGRVRADDAARATIVGVHDQTLFGVRFVTHHYWFVPTFGPTP